MPLIEIIKTRILDPVPKCRHTLGGTFCPDCGKRLILSPITNKDVVDGFVAGWLRKGFRQTLAGLFIAPGSTIRRYLAEDRDTLIKPVAYLTLTAAFALWAHSLAGDLACDADASAICHALFSNLVYIQVFQALIVALLFRFVFFSKHGNTLWELVTLNMFLLAQCFVISGIFSLLFWSMRSAWITPLSIGIRYVYVLISFIQFFRAKSIFSIIKVAAAYIVSALVFYAGLGAVGIGLGLYKFG